MPKTKSLNQDNKYFNLTILFFIVVVFIVFNYAFRTSLLVGFIVAVLTYPIYNFLKVKLETKLPQTSSNLSAIFTLIGVTVIFAVILNILANQLVREIPKFAFQVYENIKGLPFNSGFLEAAGKLGISQEVVAEVVRSFENLIQPSSSGGFSISSLFNQENVNNALNISQQAFGIIFNQVTYLVLFFLAWFNGLVFGKQWINGILNLAPTTIEENSLIKKDLVLGIRNVVYANLLSGLIHTAICFVIMLIFGVPNIFIISIIVFLLGFLPASPSELGYAIPIAIIFPSNPVAAIIIAILAELTIIYVNNVFLPGIVLAGTEGNPLFVITSVLAGLAIFGLMGFIIGPLIMIFANTLIQIISRRINHKNLDYIEEAGS